MAKPIFFDEVVAHVQSGMTLPEACKTAGVNDDRFRTTIREDAEKIARLDAALKAAGRRGYAVQRKAKQHVVHTDESFDEALERIATTPTGGFDKVLAGSIHITTLRNRAKRDPDFRVRLEDALRRRESLPGYRPTKFKTKDFERAVAFLKEKPKKRSLRGMDRVGGALPSESSIRKRRKKDAAFAAAIAELIEVRREMIARPVRREYQTGLLRRALRNNALYVEAVRVSRSRALTPDVRDDVVSELILRVLDGQIAPTAMAAHLKVALQDVFLNRDAAYRTSLDVEDDHGEPWVENVTTNEIRYF